VSAGLTRAHRRMPRVVFCVSRLLSPGYPTDEEIG